MPLPSSSIQPCPGASPLPPSTPLAVHQREADVDLDRRLGEREVARAQPQHDVVALEERLEEGLERPLEVAEVDVAVDHQPFDLVEHRRVGGVAVGAVDPARRDDPQRRAVRHHRAHLHRARCACAAASRAAVRVRRLVGEIERVVHRPRRVALGHVERGEVVPVVLDLGPGGDREAEVGEDLGELVHHLADRVDRAPAALPAPAASGRASRSPAALRARPLPAPPCAPPARRRPPSRSAWIAGAFGLAAPRGHRAERLEQRRDAALLAEVLDAQRLERGQVRRRADPRARFAFEGSE